MITLAFFAASVAFAGLVLWRRVGVNLSLSSALLGLLLLLHGPAYWYYTRVWGPDTDFFETILTAAPGRDVIGTLDVALGLTFVFAACGVLFTDMTLGVTRRRWAEALRRWSAAAASSRRDDKERILVLSTALLLFLLVPFLVIDQQLPKVWEYFTSDLGEFEKIALRREEGGSSFYLYNLLLGNLLPFLAFCLLALPGDRRAWSRVLTVSFVLTVMIGKGATLSKAPLAIFALQCVLVWYMRRALSLSRKSLLLLTGFVCTIFAAMSWIANPRYDEVALVFEFLFYRVFMIVNEGLLEYFSAIPAVLPHFWGSHFSWVAALLQSAPTAETYWLVGEVHRGVLGSTTTVMFLGDAWADFAWPGVVVVAFLAGAIARWIDIRLIVRRGKSAAAIAGLALGQYGVFIALSTALQTALVTGGLILVLPFVSLVSRRRRAPNVLSASPQAAS